MKKTLLLLVALFMGLTGYAQSSNLETPYFYFDNVDGTIESYPQYVYRGLENRMMNISSSKYATIIAKNAKRADMPDIYDNLMFLMGRQTRTAVFVFDGKESSKGGAMTATVYASSLNGLWGAMWEAMRDKVAEAIPNGVKVGSAKDYMSQGKPEELMFNGHEAMHMVQKMDMSNSWFTLAAAANIEMVFDMYVYYDEEYDKIVGVVFTYSNVKEVTSRNENLAIGIWQFLCHTTGETTTDGSKEMATIFQHQDMKDYFSKHFHLKKTPSECPATFEGTPREPRIHFCDSIIDINIQHIFPGSGEGGGNRHDSIPKVQPRDSVPRVEPGDSLIKIREPQPPKKPGAGVAGAKYGVVQLTESIEALLEEDETNIYILEVSYGQNGVIGVEKQTGRVFEAVPTKAKKDHPNIQSIGSDGKHLYIDVNGIGIIRYDGKSIESSKVLVNDPDFKPGWTGMPFKRIIFSPNGRYMAYVGTRAKVYDLQNDNKCIKDTYECGGGSAVLTDDGDLFSVDNYRVLVTRNEANTNDGDKTSLVSDITGGAPCQLHLVGNEVYITGGPKLLKTDVKKFDWQVVSTIPGGPKYKLSDLSTAGKGFAVTDTGGNGLVHATFSTAGDAPKLMKKIITNLKNQYRQDIDTHNVTNVHIDSMGNVWLQYSPEGFVVYNATGIVGLKAVAGKFVLYK